LSTVGRLGFAVRAALALFAVASAGAASAGALTYVSLAGRDDSLPKLGRPGIAVHVAAEEAGDPAHATVVGKEVKRELGRLVHTRPLATDEPGDYALEIKLIAPKIEGSGTSFPFEAILADATGERLWRIEGRSDVVDAPLDASIYLGIGRNVVSALIHDGWLQPRYDPDDPPPQAPRVIMGREATSR